jgi:hypothetical protein
MPWDQIGEAERSLLTRRVAGQGWYRHAKRILDNPKAYTKPQVDAAKKMMRTGTAWGSVPFAERYRLFETKGGPWTRPATVGGKTIRVPRLSRFAPKARGGFKGLIPKGKGLAWKMPKEVFRQLGQSPIKVRGKGLAGLLLPLLAAGATHYAQRKATDYFGS